LAEYSVEAAPPALLASITAICYGKALPSAPVAAAAQAANTSVRYAASVKSALLIKVVTAMVLTGAVAATAVVLRNSNSTPVFPQQPVATPVAEQKAATEPATQ